MQCRRLLGPVVVLILLLVLGGQLNAQSNDAARAQADDRPAKYVANEILVRFRRTASTASRARVHAANAATPVKRFRMVRDLELVRLPQSVTVDSALRKYRRDPAVAYAEPNYVRRTFDTPNDPMFPQLWGLHNTGQNGGTPGADIHAPEAWALSKGSQSVVVAVIDTGVEYTHEDLAANMWRNTADCNSNGVDDDGDGYVDDCYGINTAYNNSDPLDDSNHGTHVAGTIGAAGNNGIGVVGVNWNVSILACKFLDDYGYGTDAGAIGCLEYVAAMKDRGANIVATNNSWGGGGYSQALYDAIDMHRQRGILFIAAAGNWSDTNDGAFPNYPSSYLLSNIIAVAATTSTDKLAFFSNYGRRSVHIGAPGYQILSSVRHNLYRVYSGTSMATPHVTGLAALLAAQGPNRDWKTIRNLILAGGTPLTALAETITGRRLDAAGSMTCTNSPVLSALQPTSTKFIASSGKPVVFSVLNINCGAPAGPVTVTISPGAQQVVLADNGQAPDQDANDGIYSGQWVPSSAGTYTFTFPDGQTGTIVVDPYTFSSSLAADQYRNITGTGLALNDDSVAYIETPFPISYAGSAYNWLGISDNGVITLDSWFAAGTNKPLPYAWNETLVAPFWDDLLPVGLQRNVFWQVSGSPPDRELVVEWRDLSNLGCSAGEGVKFQTVFFENSPNVLFNYADTTFGGTCSEHDGGALATIGVQFDHTSATQYSFQEASVQDGTALLATAQLPENPVPSITSVIPSSWSVSKDPTVFLVIGSNLQPGSIVLWNGKPRTTYYFGNGALRAYLDYGDLSAKGVAQISVFNAQPGGGTSNSLPFTITDPDFQLWASPQTVTIKSGQTAKFWVYTSGQPAWNGAVSLSCSDLPANATCSFSPPAIAESEASILTVSLGPSSATASASAKTTHRSPAGWEFMFLPVGIVLATVVRRRSRALAAVAIVMVVCLVLLQPGCGGSKTASVPPPPACQQCPPVSTNTTYNITLVGTAGALQHSTSITVTVTQ